MDLIERARRYVRTMEPSVAGSGGHNACFSAACALVKGFDLPEALAMQILREEFNPRCAPAWSERELQHKVRQAEGVAGEVGHLLKGSGHVSGDWRVAAGGRNGAAVAEGQARVAEAVKKGQALDRGLLERQLVRGLAVTAEWLMERSPVDVRYVDTPELFLGNLYEAGEKILVCTRLYSQGDYGFQVMAGEGKWPGRGYQLGERPGMAPVRVAELPRRGRGGVWYLSQPVDGEWKPNGGTDKLTGLPTLGRRSGTNVTSWRYLLLESDTLKDVEWLNVLGQLPLPIAAMYTSGGSSVHAILRMGARTQDESRQMTKKLAPVLAKLGGDWKAMTSVRLTRLPGCLREGTEKEDERSGKKRYFRYPEPVLQRLLWLDPEAGAEPLLTKPKVRDLREM